MRRGPDIRNPDARGLFYLKIFFPWHGSPVYTGGRQAATARRDAKLSLVCLLIQFEKPAFTICPENGRIITFFGHAFAAFR